MAGAGERFGGDAAETAGGAGDQDDFLAHDGMSWWGMSFERGQMTPPLARSTWPLIQAPSGPARNATALAMSSGWPRRSSGESFASWSMTACGLPSRKSAVAVGPGATAF